MVCILYIAVLLVFLVAGSSSPTSRHLGRGKIRYERLELWICHMVGLDNHYNAPWMMLLFKDTRSMSHVIFRANVKLKVVRYLNSEGYLFLPFHHRSVE